MVLVGPGVEMMGRVHDVLYPVEDDGPGPATSRRPFTRRTLSPLAWSSMESQMPNAAQSTGPSKVKDVEWVRAT